MSSTDNRRAAIVGLFIAIGLFILILGIFTLGNQQKTFVKGLHIYAKFTDVSGLIKGENVWFSGVKIGTIKSITFSGIHEVNVEMNIDGAVQKYIHKNSGARISSEGFIGNKIVVIDGGTADAPIIQNNDVLVADKMLSTDDIMKTLQKNNENLLAITGDFRKLSSQIVHGKGLVGELMTDSSMATKFRGIVQNIANTTESTQRMASELNRFGNKVNSRGGLADKVFTDTTVFSKLQASANQLQAATSRANTITDNLIHTSDNLSHATDKLNTTDNALGVLLNDQQTATQMKSTLNNLQSGSVKLNDDLEAVQHNFLLKGFFRKKAKQEAEIKELDSLHIAPKKIKVKN